jgi:hypothetical protein
MRERARIGGNVDGDVISTPGGRGVKVALIPVEAVGVMSVVIVALITGFVGDTATVIVALACAVLTVADGQIVTAACATGVGLEVNPVGWHATTEIMSAMHCK